VIDSLCSKLADRLAQKELVSIPPDGAGAMDQRKSIEQFKDSDYTTVLTLTFEDKERAATRNGCRHFQRCLCIWETVGKGNRCGSCLD
jgi:hypothetical protein